MKSFIYSKWWVRVFKIDKNCVLYSVPNRHACTFINFEIFFYNASKECFWSKRISNFMHRFKSAIVARVKSSWLQLLPLNTVNLFEILKEFWLEKTAGFYWFSNWNFWKKIFVDDFKVIWKFIFYCFLILIFIGER